MSFKTLLHYQKKLVNEAKDKLDEHKQVGLDVFARGGKSFIAMELINYLMNEKGCKKFLVVAPKSITNNLRLNLFKSYNNITYIGKEMLSRGNSLEELIKASGESPSCIDAIIFDEAHTMFGENIGAEISRALTYIKSKYVIAMTATPYSNLKGFDSLEYLIKKECILHYDFNEAVKNKDIRTVKYIPAVLKYNSSCYEKIKELDRNAICKNAYVVNLIDQLENQIKTLEGDLEDKLFNYVKDKVCLDSAEGGRVFVFFNRVDEIKENREVIINTIKRLYTYWGNKNTKVNFYEYTSNNTKSEDAEVLEMINREPELNTIDVIATVNKGSMGIHPPKVHFGLIMCGTKSITKYMQLVGRITNLTQFDKHDTVIFDFRNNRSFLGKTTINVGRQRLRDRRSFKRNRALTMFNEEEIHNSFDGLVELKPCEQMETTIDLYERIKHLMVLTENNEETFDFILKALDDIDKYADGNIMKYLDTLVNQYKNNLRIYGEAEYRKRLQIYEKYNQLRKAYMFDGLSEADRESLDSVFNLLGYRIYIDRKDNEHTIKYIKELYEDFNNIGNSNLKIRKFVDKYCQDYLTDNMTSGCCAIIQSREKVTRRMLGKANELLTSEHMVENVNPVLVEMVKRISGDLKLLNALDKTGSSDKTDKAYLELSILYKLINTCRFDEKSNAYADNIIRYIDKFYGDLINTANSRLHCRDEKPKLEKITAIIDGVLNNNLHVLGSHNTSLERTVAMISKTKRFEEIDEIYKIALRIIKVNSTKTFNKKVVPMTYMDKLVDNYLESFDRFNLTKLEYFISREDLPEQLNKKLSSYNNDKITYRNCSDRDLRIAVQSLLKENNKEHVDLLRNSIRKKRTTDEFVIMNAFSANVQAKDMEEVKKFISNQDFNKSSVVKATLGTTLTTKILLRLSESGALHKEYSDKVKEMLVL